MDNLTEQAKRVLEVYLERGETALREFRSENVDQALICLRDRKAAFYNLRVVLAKVEEQGIDLSGYSIFAGLLSKLQSVDNDLKDEIFKAREMAEEQAKRLSAARRKIGKYRSAEETLSRFEQPV